MRLLRDTGPAWMPGSIADEERARQFMRYEFVKRVGKDLLS